MADYTELIKAMRHCVYGDCVDCKYYPSQNCHELLTQAADAIEELSEECRTYKELMCNEHNRAAELAWEKEHQWIPVTEQLPEDDVYVLGCYKNNDMAVVKVFDHDEDITFWRAQTDEGWEADCDTEPTYWMPLPAPPKEETE